MSWGVAAGSGAICRTGKQRARDFVTSAPHARRPAAASPPWTSSSGLLASCCPRPPPPAQRRPPRSPSSPPAARSPRVAAAPAPRASPPSSHHPASRRRPLPPRAQRRPPPLHRQRPRNRTTSRSWTFASPRRASRYSSATCPRSAQSRRGWSSCCHALPRELPRELPRGARWSTNPPESPLSLASRE